ncbi:DUF1016 domain-containing protein [bacterium]|nr:DUF1016 domain-containing protein [bacterium]
MFKQIKIDKDYADWLKDLGQRYRKSQIKAAVRVNSEMLHFYWTLGRDIEERQAENRYGSAFYETLSRDLKTLLPEAKGFSVRNLKYIKLFYLLYSKWQQVVAKSAEDAIIFCVPWGHHVVLMDKFADNPAAALFYVHKTVEEGWSRNMLLNMIATHLHLREKKAISNFTRTLPAIESDLAQQITKDPYIFDFTNLREPYIERELKESLLKNISKFLLELGNGFAYVGQEYRLKVGDTEKFTDLLFYHLKLRCYVVIEVKTEKFDPAHLGQLGFYVTTINHQLKTDNDNPTIGLLVCKTKDDVVAQYSLEGYNLPISISQYDLNSLIPRHFKSSLPSIEDIENKLKSVSE